MIHEGLWKQLEKLDNIETAHRAKCQYHVNPERFVTKMLNANFVVIPAENEIYPGQHDLHPGQANFFEQLCILAYLIIAFPPIQLRGNS